MFSVRLNLRFELSQAPNIDILLLSMIINNKDRMVTESL